MINVTYLGHSSFKLEGNGKTVLIDPFISGNPMTDLDPGQVKPDLILLTHGHGDHLGDAIDIAKKSGAEILGVFELMNYCAGKGVENVHPAHMGGKIKYDFGWVRLVPALHSSSSPDGVYTGNPVGFVINFFGHHFYHAGDTGLFGDMALISKVNRVDTAMLPIGGTFTMDVDEAAEAVALIKPANVIPMHYNTFPPIQADPDEFKKMVESRVDSMVTILKPGETTKVELKTAAAR
jgi:L-ascorbate metabolism protein UlaG (beta-lactamase superfamily)